MRPAVRVGLTLVAFVVLLAVVLSVIVVVIALEHNE